MSAITTFIPSAAKRSARANPIPLAAPVTTATRSLKVFTARLPPRGAMPAWSRESRRSAGIGSRLDKGRQRLASERREDFLAEETERAHRLAVAHVAEVHVQEQQIDPDGLQGLDLPDASLGTADNQTLPRVLRRRLVLDGIRADHPAAHALAAEVQVVPRAMRLRHVGEGLPSGGVRLRHVRDAQEAEVAVGL